MSLGYCNRYAGHWLFVQLPLLLLVGHRQAGDCVRHHPGHPLWLQSCVCFNLNAMKIVLSSLNNQNVKTYSWWKYVFTCYPRGVIIYLSNCHLFILNCNLISLILFYYYFSIYIMEHYIYLTPVNTVSIQHYVNSMNLCEMNVVIHK